MTTTTTAPDGAIIKASIESVQTAVAGFDKIAAGLAELEASHPLDVVCEVGTPAGMRQAIASRAAYREPRIAVQKRLTEVKRPLNDLKSQLSDHVDAIVARLSAGEGHYDAQIKAEEERKEKMKQERAAAEAKRIARHQQRIANDIVMATRGALGESAATIAIVIADVDAIVTDEENFDEFHEVAAGAKSDTLAKLRELHAEAVAREAEQARIAAERAELERLRAEQAERDRVERERVAAEVKAWAAKMDAERADLERQQAEADAARKAADEKAAAERAEADRVAREAHEAEERRIAAERTELARQQEAAKAEQKRLDDEAAAVRKAADDRAAAERAEAERVAREQREAEERRIEAERAEIQRQRDADMAAAQAEQRRKDAEAEAARRAAQEAKDRVREAGPQMLDALRSVAASGGWDGMEDHVQQAVKDAIHAAEGLQV